MQRGATHQLMGVHRQLAPLQPRSLDALRLFPLPDTVLFPGTVLPLHVFEPRYRAMVADALNGDRILAVALLRNPEDGVIPHPQGDLTSPPIHDVVGVGRITHVQQSKDGRYHLALEGVARARLVRELPQDRPYRQAEGQALMDQWPPEAAVIDARVQVLQACVLKLVTRMGDHARPLRDLMDQLNSPSALADVLCAAALQSAAERQRALALSRVDERLELATQAIADLLLRQCEEHNPQALPV